MDGQSKFVFPLILATHTERLISSSEGRSSLACPHEVLREFVLGKMCQLTHPLGEESSFVFDALGETNARAAADRSLPSSPVVLFRHAHARELQKLRQRPSLVLNFCQTYFSLSTAGDETRVTVVQ